MPMSHYQMFASLGGKPFHASDFDVTERSAKKTRNRPKIEAANQRIEQLKKQLSVTPKGKQRDALGVQLQQAFKDRRSLIEGKPVDNTKPGETEMNAELDLTRLADKTLRALQQDAAVPVQLQQAATQELSDRSQRVEEPEQIAASFSGGFGRGLVADAERRAKQAAAGSPFPIY